MIKKQKVIVCTFILLICGIAYLTSVNISLTKRNLALVQERDYLRDSVIDFIVLDEGTPNATYFQSITHAISSNVYKHILYEEGNATYVKYGIIDNDFGYIHFSEYLRRTEE